jgi:hypothetical protein
MVVLHMVLLLFQLLFYVSFASAGNRGVDISVSTTADQWNCLKTIENVSFAIIRTYRSVGLLDTNATASLHYAYNTGIRNLGAYIFPCIPTSAYSISHNITCDSPEAQMVSTIEYLENNGIHILRSKEKKIKSLSVIGPVVNRIWLDVEDESPSKYYDENPEYNTKFLKSMEATAASLDVFLGVYTKKVNIYL